MPVTSAGHPGPEFLRELGELLERHTGVPLLGDLTSGYVVRNWTGDMSRTIGWREQLEGEVWTLDLNLEIVPAGPIDSTAEDVIDARELPSRRRELPSGGR